MKKHGNAIQDFLIKDSEKILELQRPYSLKDRYDFLKKDTSLNKQLISGRQDPTYLSFVLLFDSIDAINSPFLSTSMEDNTALKYLNDIKDFRRVKYLEHFIEAFKSINKNMPWFWQSIDGIDNLFKLKGLEDTYRGGDDSILTINTLESIELPISGLMNLYRHICYDTQYGRVILPENLRKFGFLLYISEIRLVRNSRHLKNTGTGVLKYDTEQDQRDKAINYLVGENSPYYVFSLSNCEFNYDESFESFGNLSKEAPEAIGGKIVINYENVDLIESQTMPGYLGYKMTNKENYIMQSGDGSKAEQAGQFGKESFDLDESEEEIKRANKLKDNSDTLESLDDYISQSSKAQDNLGIVDGYKGKQETLPIGHVEAESNAADAQSGPLSIDPIYEKEDGGFAQSILDQVKELGNSIEDSLLAAPERLKNSAIQYGQDLVSGYVNSLLLGNVYGLNVHTVGQALEQASVQGLRDVFSGSDVEGIGPAIGSNVHERGASSSNAQSNNPDNVYDEQ